MCGICGKLYFDKARRVTPHELRQMSAMLVHRGPDGAGVWVDGNVGLAHQRLAIIDLRPEAGQPMSNEDGSLWVTFNGEIYNFQELRQELEEKGHPFRTNSDTEIIVHAYEEYGRECVTRFRGMFAFALWNAKTRTLLLARDRVGKKPLFYALTGDRFLFGSEIKALLADRSLAADVDPASLDHYLALGYVPAPLTAFRGIRKLPPAHWLEFRDGCITMGRYWTLHYTPKRKLTFPDAITELRRQLSEAVRLRLISDVPLGVFLSGGIDSSAIVAYMARQLNSPVRTFSVGFEEDAFDERPYARTVAERFGTEHTELLVKATSLDVLPRIVWHYDEPFGDPSAVPSYAIAELTREHVTVVLNGDGGDESFAGYNRYVQNRRAHRGDFVPLSWRRAVASAVNCLPQSWRQRRPLHKLTTVTDAMAQTPERRYSRWFGQFDPPLRQHLYTADFLETLDQSDPESLFIAAFQQGENVDWTDATLAADVSLYLPEDLLVKMDRASMAHSLEARSPFLDHVLMEFAASLPPEFKLAGQQKKRILKAALRGILPDEILDRPKRGFDPPIGRWLRTNLRDMAHDILLAPRAIQRGYFRRASIETLLTEHATGREDHALHLWELLMLELWQRLFIDGEGFPTNMAEPYKYVMQG